MLCSNPAWVKDNGAPHGKDSGVLSLFHHYIKDFSVLELLAMLFEVCKSSINFVLAKVGVAALVTVHYKISRHYFDRGPPGNTIVIVVTPPRKKTVVIVTILLGLAIVVTLLHLCTRLQSWLPGCNHGYPFG